jgi:hypothetical protein
MSENERLERLGEIINQAVEAAGVFVLVLQVRDMGAREASQAPNRRQRINDEFLAQVAEIARANPHRPTAAVSEQMSTSHRNASRWVGAARERELLEGDAA